MEEILKDKRILIVDDEPDILETLKELLDMCIIDTAPDFETARKFLKKDSYAAAVLDIMGVKGYDLLELSEQKGIPALMLPPMRSARTTWSNPSKAAPVPISPKIKWPTLAIIWLRLFKPMKKNRAGRENGWIG